MKIKQIANHYFYSTYFINDIPKLSSFAEYIINSGFSNSLYHSDNYLLTNEDGSIKKHDIELKQDNFNPSGQISINEELTGYNDIYLFQAINSKLYKNFFFTESLSKDVTYIKCFLDKFIASDSHHNHQIYPILTIFSTGIVILDLQLFSPENLKEINTNDFLKDYVNLYKINFSSIKIPVSLSYLAVLENIPNLTLPEDFFENKLEDYSEDDQNFINIDLKHFYNDFDNYNLNFIKDYIFEHIEIINNDWSPKKINSLGNYWIGKPILMINDHDLIDEEKNDLIDYTLARMKYDNKKSDFIKKENLRHSNDYELYMSASVSLFINNQVSEENIDGTKISILVMEEEAIHLYLLAKQENEHIDEASNLGDIFKHKRFINYLKKKLLRTISSSGEINYIIKLLLYDHYKIQVEEDILDKIIEEKQSELLFLAEKNKNSFYNVLSLIFGIIGSSSIYEFIISPLCIDSNTSELNKVKYYLFSLVGLLVITFSLRFIYLFKDKYKKI